MSVLNDPVLMLNRAWQAVDTCSVASAFSRLFAGTANFLDMEDFSLCGLEKWLDMPVPRGAKSLTTARVSLRLPEVIVLRSEASPRRRVMQFSRRNLMRRDKHACQYCGSKPSTDRLTVDHVLPRVRGGKSCWANCVLSCIACNSRKADRTPSEAGMDFLLRPEMRAMFPHNKAKWYETYEPSWSPVFKISAEQVKESWKKFLPEKAIHAL